MKERQRERETCFNQLTVSFGTFDSLAKLEFLNSAILSQNNSATLREGKVNVR